jgi:hypothetical protein
LEGLLQTWVLIHSRQTCYDSILDVLHQASKCTGHFFRLLLQASTHYRRLLLLLEAPHIED